MEVADRGGAGAALQNASDAHAVERAADAVAAQSAVLNVFLYRCSMLAYFAVPRAPALPEKLVACNDGPISITCRLRWAVVASFFWLLGFSGK